MAKLADVNTTDLRSAIALGCRTMQSVFAGPGEQRFADVSAEYVVATDFSEDPDGKYDGEGDLADIVVFDRATQTASKRVAEKKQAFPMLVDE